MKTKLLLGTLAAGVAALGLGTAPMPAHAGEFALGATNDHGSIVTGNLGPDIQTLACKAILIESSIDVPGSTRVVDPGAEVVIDECVLKIDGVVWLSSPGLVTGPAIAHTQYVTALRPDAQLEACVSAHATLSSGEALTYSDCRLV